MEKNLDRLTKETISSIIETYYGFKPYPEQEKAGKALSEGKIVNQNTGEGKTISILIAALYLLKAGHKVFIVTSNDYLSQRDYTASKELFKALGIKTIYLEEGIGGTKYAYEKADVIYATGQTLIFDYLRGIEVEYDAVIIDEIDYILVECANHDFSVSAGETKISLPKEIFKICQELSESLVPIDKKADTKEEDILFDFNKQADYIIDYTKNSVSITSRGFELLEKMFGPATDNLLLIEALQATLIVKHFYIKNINYIVEDNKIVIIDNASGRKSPEASNETFIQTAIEQKEGVTITQKPLLHNTCSYTVFFTLFKHLSGISGTTAYVPYDFAEIYGKETKKIKDHFPSRRKLFVEEFETDVQRIKRINEIIQLSPNPVLIITDSDERSQQIAANLPEKEKTILVLDNYDLDKESELLEQCKSKDTVLISSQIVGRGTDITLPSEYDELIVILSTRLMSERAERQAIGRTGRNGKPGTAYILTSKDDRIFNYSKNGKESIKKMQDRYEQVQFNTRKYLYMRNKVFFDLDRQALEYFKTVKTYAELIPTINRCNLPIREAVVSLLKEKGDFEVSDYHREIFIYSYKNSRPYYQNQYIYHNDTMPEAFYKNTFYERTSENMVFFSEIVTDVVASVLMKNEKTIN